MNTVSADSSFSSETIDVSKGRSASQRFGIAAEEGCVKPTIVNTSDLAAVSPYMCDVVLVEGLKAVCLLPLVKRCRVSHAGVWSNSNRARKRFGLPGDFRSQRQARRGEAVPGRRDPQRDEFRKHHRYQPCGKTCSGTGGNGRDQRFHGPVARGDRNRKGVNRSRHSRPQPAERSHVCQAELCRHSDRSAGERTVWKRKGSFHRCDYLKSRTFGCWGKQRVLMRLSRSIRPAAHVLSGAFHSMAIDLQTLKHKTGEITLRFNNRDNSHERRGICRWYRNII